MTTNKIEVVGYIDEQEFSQRVGHAPFLHPTPNRGYTVPLVRLSDYEALQAQYDALQADLDSLRARTSCTMGVGCGDGRLFVHGDYESIKAAQKMLIELEAVRADRDQQYDMKVKARAQRDEAARMLKAKEAESFALAATACHGGYGDDFGHFRCNYQDEIRKLQAECEELRQQVEPFQGLKPAMPPRPPNGEGLPRYGLRWNGPSQPLSVPMDDGYWTPWHLAQGECAQLRAAIRRLCNIYVYDGQLREEFLELAVNQAIDEAMQESKPCSLSS